MKLRLVEARPVAEHAGMFAKALAVVRDDDDPGMVEDRATSRARRSAVPVARPGPRCSYRKCREPRRSAAATARSCTSRERIVDGIDWMVVVGQ